MRDDDELLEAYEDEFARPSGPARRSNRGFWLVSGTIVIGSIFLLAEIWVNRDLKDSIAHAQFSLRAAQAAAEEIETSTGSFAAAGPDALAEREPTLTYLGPDEVSRAPEEISVAATATEWGAAVETRPGACFYLHLRTGEDPLYGFGTECTGTMALRATDPRW
jgi:hypothetical protein